MSTDVDNAFRPLPVIVQNWPDKAASPAKVPQTTIKTWIIDAAGTNGPKMVQIAAYEPARVRLAVQVLDQDVTITDDPPVASPDTSTATLAPQGRHLPANTGIEYEFLGAGPFWLNSISGKTATRVTVTKEYK